MENNVLHGMKFLVTILQSNVTTKLLLGILFSFSFLRWISSSSLEVHSSTVVYNLYLAHECHSQQKVWLFFIVAHTVPIITCSSLFDLVHSQEKIKMLFYTDET